MPTILMMLGWRFFYANEANEPMHVHCRQGECEAKYRLDPDTFEAIEEHAYSMGPPDTRTVRRIIFEHVDSIVTHRQPFQERRYG